MTDSTQGTSSPEPSTPNVAIEVVDPTRRPIIRPVPLWSPPTDVFALEDRLIILVELAGIPENSFAISLQERRLTISGIRPRPVREWRAYQQAEIRYGEFRSEVILPWLVDRESMQTVYQDGLLRVELPSEPGQQIRVVDVEADGRDLLAPTGDSS